MDYLNNKHCYLSGAIQYSDGENWRIQQKIILKKDFGLDVFDPFDDPKQQWIPTLKEAQENKDYKKIAEISHSFVRKDLGLVDKSDFIIAYLQDKVPTTGTVHEIINSNNAKKPTLLVTNCDDIGKIPFWYFGFIPIEFMFAGWDNLFAYLHEVNNGLHKDNKKWDLIYGNI